MLVLDLVADAVFQLVLVGFPFSFLLWLEFLILVLVLAVVLRVLACGLDNALCGQLGLDTGAGPDPDPDPALEVELALTLELALGLRLELRLQLSLIGVVVCGYFSPDIESLLSDDGERPVTAMSAIHLDAKHRT